MHYLYTMFVSAISLNISWIGIWNWLRLLDTRLFLKVNREWTNAYLDGVAPWWRDANTWTPLYVFLIIFAVMNFRKKSMYWILFAVITLLLTDQTSSSFFKPLFARLRPCNDPVLSDQMRLLLPGCGSGFSFTSSHATNHFGFAVFLFVSLQMLLPKWRYLFLLWAATVSYAQVYVGVHYPLDVLTGAIVGSCIGYATATIFNQRFGLIEADTIDPSL